MTQEQQLQQNGIPFFINRHGQRIFRIPRGSLYSEQCSQNLERQDGQGSISLEHWILSGMGPLESDLVLGHSKALFVGRWPRYRSDERRLAKPDVDLPEFFEHGTPDPY